MLFFSWALVAFGTHDRELSTSCFRRQQMCYPFLRSSPFFIGKKLKISPAWKTTHGYLQKAQALFMSCTLLVFILHSQILGQRNASNSFFLTDEGNHPKCDAFPVFDKTLPFVALESAINPIQSNSTQLIKVVFPTHQC